MDNAIEVRREDLIEILKTLSLAAVSLDRLGSYRTTVGLRDWEHAVADWTVQSGITRQLATARKLLDPYFTHDLADDGMDELERACADLPYWSPPAR